MITNHTVGVLGSTPNKARTSFCQPTWRHTDHASATVNTVVHPPISSVRARPRGAGTPR
jgi:hypothetical protein